MNKLTVFYIRDFYMILYILLCKKVIFIEINYILCYIMT